MKTITTAAPQQEPHIVRCLEIDQIQGTEAELRAFGYTGVIPTKAGYTIKAFPGTDSADTVYWDGYGPYRWSRCLDADELVDRKLWFDLNHPIDDSRSIAGWFHNDRRKAAALALAEICSWASESRAKDAPRIVVLAALAQQALANRDFNVSALADALSARH